ncbi:MAG: GNAT family N-acetyltransferase [Lachnospiraceae bacterium]|nr:GNAT family N-acetyltransferase [Lachnospiraceae bacterium]
MRVMVENAKIADIALLTELRLAYLKEDYGELSEDDIKIIRQDLPSYFKKNLNQNIFCYLIRDKEEIAACAFLLVIEKPMSPAFITGRTGTVLNVYTKPAYRHKGYAKKIMNKILLDAVEKNLSFVELKSTEDGYHLYKSIGFTDEVSKYHSMKWYNQ